MQQDDDRPAKGGKRIRRQPETTRALILDTTEAIMRQDGYAAVTSRSIAKGAGLTPALVHYYYPTLDDVFIAVHARMTERQVEELARVLATDDPLGALWRYQCGWAQSALGVEFVALANHRKAIKAIVARRTEEAREAQVAAIARAFGDSVGHPLLTPAALTTLMVGVARMLVNEEGIGVTQGHEDVRSFMAFALAQLAAGRPAKT